MRAEVLKDFRSKGRDYKRGSVIEVDIQIFNKLSLMGLVIPFSSSFTHDEGGQRDENDREGLISKISNRSCVVCRSEIWLILKPNSKVSAIKCESCNHIELAVLSKKELKNY